MVSIKITFLSEVHTSGFFNNQKTNLFITAVFYQNKK